jgi:Double zinc ribbon domain
MGLFRRKATVEGEPERCPVCRERLPDDADECAMCGADLKPLRPSFERHVGKPVDRDLGTTRPRPIA